MSNRSFRSVFMVASCAGAALGCYLVSLRVASERAALEGVETRIVLAQRDMRMLQTEIGTRGRLSQLERWNAGAFALSAPSADQFLKGGFELARLAQPEKKVDFQAPVVLASAPAPAKQPVLAYSQSDETDAASAPTPAMAVGGLLHEASLKTETRQVPARTVVALPRTTAKSTGKPATAAKPASTKLVEKSGLAAAHSSQKSLRSPQATPAAAAMRPSVKKSVDKARIVSAKAVTRRLRIAKVDPLAPLAPLAARHSGHSRDIAAER